jgi:geranylgeranyl diphosphate synthase, type III
MLNGANHDESSKVIRAPLDYLLNLPGKDVRSKLMAAFNQWLCIPEEKLEIIKRVVMLLHNASLL